MFCKDAKIAQPSCGNVGKQTGNVGELIKRPKDRQNVGKRRQNDADELIKRPTAWGDKKRRRG